MSTTVYDLPTHQIDVEITIDGKPIHKEFPATQIVIEKKLYQIPKATVHLIDGNPVEGDESFKSATKIQIGKTIHIKAGYQTKTKRIYQGVITSKNIEQDKNGNPMMIVEAHDKAIAMQEAKKTASFQKKSDAEIINSIVGTYDVEKKITIKQKAKFETLTQYQANDWEFIKVRAQINGCIVDVQEGKLTIAPPAIDKKNGRILKYGTTIKEQSLSVSDTHQPKKVTASCWDPSQQKLNTATATEPTVNKQGDSDGKKLAKNNGSNHQLQTSIFLEQAALKAWADAYLSMLRLNTIHGRINIQGDPKIVPNTTITLEGFGKNYNGEGYIGAVKHTLLPGEWDTEIQLGIPDEVMKDWEQSNTKRVATYTGLQIGVVKQIDKDPKNEARVLVTIPSQPELKEGIWARLATIYATREKGFFFYPEIGDELILGFIEGHPSHAIILGSLFSKKHTTPHTPDDKNSTKAIITDSGLKIEFNDKEKITTIATPAGNELVMSDKDKEINIIDIHKNRIVLTKSGVTIQSKGALTLEASKEVKIKGKEIQLEASSSLEGKGKNVTLEAKSAIAFEGNASATLKSKGKTTIKGKLIGLN